MLRSYVFAALAFGALAACASPKAITAGNSDKVSKQEVVDATKPAAADECGAHAHQSLLGKLRSEIPPQPAGANWRVACTSCAVTMDYRPDRLNIFFDEKTQVIKEVKCG
jgi:hypothetical protein